ncbi:uncharacterized protein LOC124821259 [Vigna umbellata]|uniref:uncharacterized protein LOC124821259 n=1 Tax=Vigna umbellata TaxID=87088 RepID=UPI001F5EE1BA|nr:uncharacterized protein LOC124821259 [Vigna umbellata]
MAELEESARQERREEEYSEMMNVCEHCVALQNNMILPSPYFQVLSGLPPPINNHQGFNIQVRSNLPPPRNNPQDFNIQVRSSLPPPNPQGFNIQVRSNLPPPRNNPQSFNISNLPPSINNPQGLNIQVFSSVPPPTNNPQGFNGNRPSYSQVLLTSQVGNVQPSQVINEQPSKVGYVQLGQVRNAQPSQVRNVQPGQVRNVQPGQVTQGRMRSQQPSESNRQLPVPFYDFLGVENSEQVTDPRERREEGK